MGTVTDAGKTEAKTGFLKAMFYEDKNGSLLPSLHRVLAAILFVACLVVWIWMIAKTLKIPDSMIYTMWALLGINGFHKTMSVFKKPANSVAGKGASTPLDPATPQLALASKDVANGQTT